MVLIEVRGSKGVIGRCDAKCYNATEPECDCICGGINHGAGLRKARQNTSEYCDEWIEEYNKRNKIENPKATVFGIDYKQLNLF